MNKVLMPTAVGNDFVTKINSQISKTVPVEQVMPTEEFINTEPNQIENLNLSHEISAAELTLSNQPNMPHLAFVNGSIALPERHIFTKGRVLAVLFSLLLISLASAIIVEKSHIILLARNVRSDITQAIQSVSEGKTASTTNAVNPLSISVPVSNATTAFADLSSQQVSLNIGNSVVAVSSGDITSWLNLKTTKSSATISVNTSSLENYLKQAAASNSHPAVNRVILARSWGIPIVEVNGQNGVKVQYSSAAFNKIADNILKNNGVSVTLPTTNISYQTTVIHSNSY